MARLILLLAIIATVYLLLRRVRSLPPHRRRGEYIKLALGIAVVVAIGLTLTGRMHWVGAALTGLLVVLRQSLPLLVHLFPRLAAMRNKSGPGTGHSSTVEASILRMHLDHDSGDLQGEVLQGHFEGWRLADMDLEQLRELYRYCSAQDEDSRQLLESYLQRRFPGEQDFAGSAEQARPRGSMSRTEALSVLGLTGSATEQDIIDAHRRLMQKLHPDRGGSDYLAAKINQAKDLLLG